MSLNFFLRSSSAFRLARLRTGSHLVIDSRTPFASGGSVLLINIGCCLLISRPCYRRHSRFVAGELVAQRRPIEDIGFSPDSTLSNHAQEILSIARPVPSFFNIYPACLMRIQSSAPSAHVERAKDTIGVTTNGSSPGARHIVGPTERGSTSTGNG